MATSPTGGSPLARVARAASPAALMLSEALVSASSVWPQPRAQVLVGGPLLFRHQCRGWVMWFSPLWQTIGAAMQESTVRLIWIGASVAAAVVAIGVVLGVLSSQASQVENIPAVDYGLITNEAVCDAYGGSWTSDACSAP